MAKFTRERALQICERILKPDYTLFGCYSCYYNEMGRCELNHRDCRESDPCGSYVPDVSFTNRVREKIVTNPTWCKENWQKLCKVDKDLFLAIYGGGD